MKRLSHAKKRDENEPGIVDALESIGAVVHRMDTPFDLMVLYQQRTVVIEVKMPGKDLSETQQKDWDEWKGGELYLVRTVAEALAIFGVKY